MVLDSVPETCGGVQENGVWAAHHHHLRGAPIEVTEIGGGRWAPDGWLPWIGLPDGCLNRRVFIPTLGLVCTAPHLAQRHRGQVFSLRDLRSQLLKQRRSVS